MEKMGAPPPVSDEEYVAAGKAALTLINKWEKENHPADALLSMYSMVIKISLSMKRPSLLPCSPSDLVACAERHVASAKRPTALDFEQVKARGTGTFRVIAHPRLYYQRICGERRKCSPPDWHGNHT